MIEKLNLENNDITFKIDKYNSFSTLKKIFTEEIQNYSKEEQERISTAYQFAKEKHEGQLRDHGTPYFSHCLAVAILAMENRESANFVIAAFLHDVLEDTNTKVSEIENNFGKDVSDLVIILSIKVENNEKLSNKIYYKQIESSLEGSKLKAYDRISNLLSLENSPIPGKKAQQIFFTKTTLLPIIEKHHPILAEEMSKIILFLEK